MAIDERRRLELADVVKRTLGDEAGLTLMEMLPPVDWADVATTQDLASVRADIEGLRAGTKQDLAAFETRIDLRFALVDQRFDAIDARFLGLEQRFDEKLHTLRHALTSDFRGEMVALTWRYIGAMGALFVAFSALMTLVIKL